MGLALRRDGFSLAAMTMMKAMMTACELLWRVTDSLRRYSRPSLRNIYRTKCSFICAEIALLISAAFRSMTQVLQRLVMQRQRASAVESDRKIEE